MFMKLTAKTNLTVLFTFGADGSIVSPSIVFPFKRISQEIKDSVPESWGIGRSDNGWMRTEVFWEFLIDAFGLYLENKEIQKPVILFVEGHKSHLSYQISELCCELGIILIALYPNATRILQPADVSAFKPLKQAWKKRCTH